MTQINTIDKLVMEIYEDNFSHFDFIENMGGDCDCSLHTTIQTILSYSGRFEEVK